jgi:hypothetical protein
MEDSTFATVRLLPRDQLETFAVRAALQLRSDREEIQAGNAFLSVLFGFLLGAIVASSGFLLGLGLG